MYYSHDDNNDDREVGDNNYNNLSTTPRQLFEDDHTGVGALSTFRELF